MKKVKLLLGNMEFNNFTEAELKLFKANTSNKTLIHELTGVLECTDEGQAMEIGEEMIEKKFAHSYVIPSMFNGEIVLEKKPELNISEIFG